MALTPTEAATRDPAADSGVRLVTVAVPAPTGLDPLAWTFAGSGPRAFWTQPEAGLTIAGRGVAHVVDVPTGPHRFAETSHRLRTLAERIDGSTQPVLLGGAAFDDAPPGPDTQSGGEPVWSGFGPGRFVLPEVALVHSDDHAELVVTRVVPEEASATAVRTEIGAQVDALLAEPVEAIAAPAPLDADAVEVASARGDRDHYRRAVAAAVHEIHAGRLSKVVVARSIHSDARPSIAGLLAALRHAYPTCATFLLQGGMSPARGTSTHPQGTSSLVQGTSSLVQGTSTLVQATSTSFVGATPERLVALDGSRMRTAALAASAPRDPNPAIDDALGHALLASPKERAEHDFVVRAVRASLGDAGVELDGPIAPRILKLAGIQHLYTPIEGRAPAGTTVLDLAGALHPTPAVGGTPSADARRWLAANEGLDRGWYASPIGWLTPDGQGELRVALRSGVVGQSGTTLFAGAGVVEGSDPERELTETDIKLRAMLGPVLAATEYS